MVQLIFAFFILCIPIIDRRYQHNNLPWKIFHKVEFINTDLPPVSLETWSHNPTLQELSSPRQCTGMAVSPLGMASLAGIRAGSKIASHWSLTWLGLMLLTATTCQMTSIDMLIAVLEDGSSYRSGGFKRRGPCNARKGSPNRDTFRARVVLLIRARKPCR
ncbi:MAG: hypothetical protein ACM3XO_12230, partial [Bacteroidota bacterium]